MLGSKKLGVALFLLTSLIWRNLYAGDPRYYLILQAGEGLVQKKLYWLNND